MAKRNNSISFKKATIDLSTMQITEQIKDDVVVSDIMAVLKEFSRYENLTITIKQDTDGVDVIEDGLDDCIEEEDEIEEEEVEGAEGEVPNIPIL